LFLRVHHLIAGGNPVEQSSLCFKRVQFFIRISLCYHKASGSSFSFSAKEKEPKRKLSGGACFYES
jgi:hypothetical protein